MGLTLAGVGVEEGGVKVIEGAEVNWIVGWEENVVGGEALERVTGIVACGGVNE